jgi:type 1 glutamine amidotransferase
MARNLLILSAILGFTLPMSGAFMVGGTSSVPLTNSVENPTSALHYANDPSEATMPRLFLSKVGKYYQQENKDAWNKQFDDLAQFHAQHGHCHVPRRHAKLGKWIENQRLAYQVMQEGSASPLTQSGIDRLNSIHFEWQFESSELPAEKVMTPSQPSLQQAEQEVEKPKSKRTTWSRRYGQLKRFKSKNRHAMVAPHTPLGSWLKAQKWEYKLHQLGQDSKMTTKRVSMLTSLGVFGRGEAELVIAENKFYSAFIDYEKTEEEKLAALRQRFQQYA